ncbi:hypothetical protein ACF060_33325 [Streptomyces werraensis]|nr:hypothetical protein [Streptomyces viridodiastaticus]MCP9994449.1 hypothetical protein [Streptomyces albogriseolus]MCX4625145.1 hypothetical protein [Streptomyces viridodiastaticus]
MADQTTNQGQQNNHSRLRRTVSWLLKIIIHGVNFFGNVIRIIEFF